MVWARIALDPERTLRVEKGIGPILHHVVEVGDRGGGCALASGQHEQGGSEGEYPSHSHLHLDRAGDSLPPATAAEVRVKTLTAPIHLRQTCATNHKAVR